MNYKELLDRYKKGLLSEEEKQLVEEELEKHEAFEEYISETLDEEFNITSETSTNEVHDRETTELKKSVNHKLRKVVYKSVAIVFAIYIGIFYVVSGIVDNLYYDPTSISKTNEQEYDEYQLSDFYYDMQAYISVNMPGHVSNSFTFQNKKGFGKYDISYSLKDLFTKNEQRYFMDLSRGKLSHGMDGAFSSKNLFNIWEGFEMIQFPNEEIQDSIGKSNRITKNNEQTIRYLNELNPLSYISMSIVFDEDFTMEELYHMINKDYTSINFKWAGIRTVDKFKRWSETQPMHLIGFNPNRSDEPSSSQRPNSEKYPFFYLADIWDELKQSKKDYPDFVSEAYGTHFKSRIEYLRDREQFVKIFDYNDYNTEFYNDALSYIDENGIKTYGVLVYGTAEEFLKYIDEISYDSIYINEVLSAKPNIYYD